MGGKTPLLAETYQNEWYDLSMAVDVIVGVVFYMLDYIRKRCGRTRFIQEGPYTW